MFYEVLNEKQLKVLEKISYQMPIQGGGNSPGDRPLPFRTLLSFFYK
ncbi:hypothetical protein CHY_1821 [Carboxydothermus hydrogenoformans Z-2901]|uniref:Uncharacterized protein n=1 Tax=Carboxydothermus hydrogenoformans (strain ATCC BAA-161 / DSM 6008 / Z-2901) TaxID=246194 RepID=Q3AB43_CARHZ|nr:hypothetical protein CHY_1821 [Carboxydothermus hydrogenoformans Z-2901]